MFSVKFNKAISATIIAILFYLFFYVTHENETLDVKQLLEQRLRRSQHKSTLGLLFDRTEIVFCNSINHLVKSYRINICTVK
jgi:hypothetical protein